MKNNLKEEIKNIDYKIVSLGGNCLPRTILTRWGIKPAKSQGELTTPFDVATFETFEITHSLANDFNDFFENLEFKKNNSLWNFFTKNKNYWKKLPDKIEFVHENNIQENDKKKLIKTYENRIENFYKTITSNTPILFVQILGDCQDVENLYKEIKAKRGALPFKMLIIDTQDIVKYKNEDIVILKLPFPNENYKKNWWKKSFYKSVLGIEFEEKIVKKAISTIKTFKTNMI